MTLLLSVAGTGGQSLEDKLQAIKYFISGQGLSFVVLKATTSEILGPKKKHLIYLAAATNEPNLSVSKLVKCLLRRARHIEWSVAFKALITIHYLMDNGNERFIQNLASSSAPLRTFEHLSSFTDRSCNQAYDMSTFVRRHSRYISAKIQTYRTLGTDFCKIKTNGLLASNQSSSDRKRMRQDQLLMLLSTLQTQFDTLLAFDASARDLNNGIINSAFAMLYKDFVKLFISYQSAIIRLLELFYSINQVKKLQELLDAYRKYLVRMEKVTDFMRVIDAVGMDKKDLPDDITKLPHFNLRQLESRIKFTEQTCASSRIYERVQSVELPKPDRGRGSLCGRRGLRREASKSPKIPGSSGHERSSHEVSKLEEESKDELKNKKNGYSYIDLCPLDEPNFRTEPAKGCDSDIQDLLLDMNDEHPAAYSGEQQKPSGNNDDALREPQDMPTIWGQVD